jgi:hypothetical protein
VRPAAPHNQANEVVEEENEPERAEHLVEMRSLVERAQPHGLDRQPQHRRERDGHEPAQHEAAGPYDEGRREVGAHHEHRGVPEIHEIHDAEDERQPRRHQEQQQGELDAVEGLLEKRTWAG